VRNRIEALLRALGLTDAPDGQGSSPEGASAPPAADGPGASSMTPATDALAAARRRVLERLAAHEIDASAAAAALRSLERTQDDLADRGAS